MAITQYEVRVKKNHSILANQALVMSCVIAIAMNGCGFSGTDRATWSNYSTQGSQARNEKRYDEAEKNYEKALEIAEKGRLGDETLIESLNDLSETYRLNNRSEKCISLYKKAINIGEHMKSSVHQYFADSRWQLAVLKSYVGLMEIYGDLGYYRDAESYYNKAKDWQVKLPDSLAKSINLTARYEHILKKRAAQRSLELTDISAWLNGSRALSPMRERYFRRFETAQKTMRSGRLGAAQKELESLLADTKVDSGVRHHRYRDALRLLTAALRQQNKLAQCEALLVADMRNYDYATAQGLDYEREPDTVIDAQRWLEDGRQLLEIYRLKGNTNDSAVRQLLAKMQSVRARTGVHIDYGR